MSVRNNRMTSVYGIVINVGDILFFFPPLLFPLLSLLHFPLILFIFSFLFFFFSFSFLLFSRNQRNLRGSFFNKVLFAGNGEHRLYWSYIRMKRSSGLLPRKGSLQSDHPELVRAFSPFAQIRMKRLRRLTSATPLFILFYPAARTIGPLSPPPPSTYSSFPLYISISNQGFFFLSFFFHGLTDTFSFYDYFLTYVRVDVLIRGQLCMTE